MAGKLNMGLILLVALDAFFQGSAAITYSVGTYNGWAIPSDSSAYDTWAAGKTFSVGDILVFNFTTGAHDVAEVTKSGFDGCDGNNPILVETNGPASITLTSSGQKYYICTFGSHCSFGQKLAITVASSTPSSPPPQSATPPPMASSPPPASPPATPPPMAASPPPMASSPAPHASPPTTSTPVPAGAPRSSSPVPAVAPSPPPTFHSPTPTPSSAAPPQSSAAPPTTSTGASPPTTAPSTPSENAPGPSSAPSLGFTGSFTAFLITATVAMMIQ